MIGCKALKLSTLGLFPRVLFLILLPFLLPQYYFLYSKRVVAKRDTLIIYRLLIAASKIETAFFAPSLVA